MSQKIEEWRDIEGYEGLYQVSDWGRIKGLERFSTNNIFIKEHIKSKHSDKDGYEMVNLKKNGKHSTKKVHRLVANAFIPNLENKPLVDHINGIRDDNRVENLRWFTSKENSNTPLAREHNSESSKKSVRKRNRDNLGRFIS